MDSFGTLSFICVRSVTLRGRPKQGHMLSYIYSYIYIYRHGCIHASPVISFSFASFESAYAATNDQLRGEAPECLRPFRDSPFEHRDGERLNGLRTVGSTVCYEAQPDWTTSGSQEHPQYGKVENILLVPTRGSRLWTMGYVMENPPQNGRPQPQRPRERSATRNAAVSFAP